MFKTFLSWINQKSIIFRWLLSYLVLIVIFGISTAISIGYFYNTFKQETLRTNKYILDVAGKEFDTVFSDMRNIIHGVTDDSVRKMIVTDLKEAESKEYVYSLIQQSLKRITGNPDGINQCFLYLEDYDMVISTQSVLDSKLYYSAYFRDSGIDYDQWLEIISKDSYNSFITSGDSASENFMFVSKNAFSIIYRENSTSLTFVLDSAALSEMNQRIYDTSGAYIMMVDSKGNIVNFSGNDAIGGIKLHSAYSNDGVDYIMSNGTEYVLTIKEISEGNMLMLVTPRDVFYSKLISIMLLQVLVLLLIILVSVALAVIFSKMHFSPVKALLSTLNAKGTGEIKNEYKVISDIIAEFQSEKKSLDIRLSRQELRLKNNFVRGLIRGEEYALASAPESLKNYNIDFNLERFMVLIFEITDYDEIWTGFSRKEADFATLRFAIDNIVSELVSQKYPCCTVNMFDGVACIVNFPSAVSEKKIQNELSNMYLEVKKHIFEKLGFSFRMVGGSAKDNLAEISISYTEALSCLEYNQVYGKKIMFMDNTNEHSSKELNIFFGKSARLIKLICQGSQTDIEQAAEEWSRMYVSLVSAFPNVMQYELSGIMNSIVRELFSLNYDEGETRIFTEKLTGKYKPDSLKGYNEIRTALLGMSRDIRAFIEGNTGMDYLEKRVMDYLEQNYTDPELNVSGIAEHFKLNPTYLSSTFKKTAKVGILEKINKYRCDKAVSLLTSTDHTINDIAVMVGYSSAHTFIRIFKKYYFVTPTQYRTETRRWKNE